MRKIGITLLAVLFSANLFSQNRLHTQPLDENIKTIQLKVNDNGYLPPIIQLNGNDRITLSFDNLTMDEPRLRYRLIHCSSDWLKDDLNEIEYQNGFNDQPLEAYRFSENTTVSYIHYDLTLPNPQIQPKISGNYAIEVYYPDAPDAPLLRACFSVAEAGATIQSEVSPNTNIDTHREHQQLNFTVRHPSLSLRDPMNEIKVNVIQNNRLDNAVWGIRPSFVGNNTLTYNRKAELIFKAANEYRRFEITNRNYGGMNVQQIQYRKPYYEVVLREDAPRSKDVYQYDQDQNGRFFVKNKDAADSDIQADYFRVFFVLETGNADNVFLNGDFTYGDTENYKLSFDRASQTCQLPVILKQGAYNYQYLTQENGKPSTAQTEGNYYETENEYLIMVYARTSGSRYDKLVGWQTVNSTSK